MSLSKKNAIYGLLLLGAMLLVFEWRKQNQAQLVVLEGKTMGTSYQIKYLGKAAQNYQVEIDSILLAFNQSLSTYIPDSEISTFNQTDSIFEFNSIYFFPVLEKSKEVFEKTNGAFDPTVMPLVNAWGFGPKKLDSLPLRQIDSLKTLVDFKKIGFDKNRIWKVQKNMQLDFSAIAKGYGVDVIANFLRDRGIENFMVEIGGEVVAYGKNAKNQLWTIAIDNPKTDQERQAIVRLENRALATSGNYRNFYLKDGKKYAHTISPQTGLPIEHSLLSASVFAPNCMTADAYATAFMVLGKDKAIEIAQREALDIFLIFEQDGKVQTYASPGLKDFLME